MTKNFYVNIEKNYRTNGTTYGGIIKDSDYSTRHTPGNMASRIVSDSRFDKWCRENSIARDKNKRKRKDRQK